MTNRLGTFVAPDTDAVPRTHRLWSPKRVLVTRAAAEQPHTAEIVRRCEAAGVGDIAFLAGNRLTGLSAETERETYARAKSTMAVVVAPPSAAEAAADPAQCRLAHRPRPRLPGSLSVLLPGRVADRTARHPGVRQPRRGAGRHRHSTLVAAR
ncbi:MAG: hypothetical protein WKF73_03050 [Nocardioidaceae bacterium]